MRKIVTRIAPSPTGYLHFGLARTALFNYLLARQQGGEYIVRIEDTDAARNKPEYEEDIFEQFRWLGLEGDRVYRQSEHKGRHKECLQTLIDKDLAYVSHEASKDDPQKMVEVIRLRNKGERVAFTDMVRGEISFDTTELGDFVIARSIDDPLYHLAVVIDDHDEDVSHVIRGEDHVSNTPRQILIHRALGFDVPVYAHIPLILMPDKSKMSKRKHETSVKNFREHGFLPQALVNYVALVGWNPGTEQEIFSIEDLISTFDIAHIHKNGAVFDIAKLRWFNHEYLKTYSDEAFQDYISNTFLTSLTEKGFQPDGQIIIGLLPIIRDRIENLDDLKKMISDGEFDFCFTDPTLDPTRIPGKGSEAQTAAQHLIAVRELLAGVSQEDFASSETIKNALWEYASETGRGAVLWPLRYALTGREKSPDPFLVASIVSKEAVLRRIDAALALLKS